MKKGWIGFLGVLVLWSGLSTAAFGWERATHAFIVDLLKKGGSFKEVEKMYAATAPDAFNYLFTFPGLAYRDWLYQQTHYEFMKVVDAAKEGKEKDSAFGFASHNNVWGADTTAHTKSLTLDPTEGYIITKAKLLNSFLMSNPGYAALLGDYQDVAIEICHNIVEAAGDVILNRYDPMVGQKLVAIAKDPKPDVRDLMVKAYAHDLAEFSKLTPYPLRREEAKQLIIEAENKFRMGIIGYGYLLQGDEGTLIANIVEQFKGLAGAFLTAYGLPVPDDETLTPLIQNALALGIQICQGDYMTEVLATADFVQHQLKAHKINK